MEGGSISPLLEGCQDVVGSHLEPRMTVVAVLLHLLWGLSGVVDEDFVLQGVVEHEDCTVRTSSWSQPGTPNGQAHNVGAGQCHSVAALHHPAR